MKFLTSICFSLVLLTLSSTFSPATAATFDIHNNCPYTVWAAAVPGGGRQLNNGDTWTISANPGQTQARIWARTGCSVTGPNGLRCNTGDCNGVLQCTQYGSPPNTLAEYSLGQFSNLDFFDISLIDGFNVPMSFLPISNGCTNGATCSADLNGPCPGPLRVNGGCYSSCRCGPNDNSRYFKGKCPQAYSYPEDTTLFTCPNGANYRVTFCP